MQGPLAIPFGDPRRLIARQQAGPGYLPTRQDPAIIVCGGGDPFAEAKQALELCEAIGATPTIFVGNDMIACWTGAADHATTLHPNKGEMWFKKRTEAGHPAIPFWWAHRPFPGFNRWTRDWAGSTGLFSVKVARELGFTHVLLCGVHMSADSGHFVRHIRWSDCNGFKYAWQMRTAMLKPYLRSYGGWTKELFGEPTREWLEEAIEDRHRQFAPPNSHIEGMTA